MSEHAPQDIGYDPLIEIIKRRRSVRKFEAGRSVPRITLERELKVPLLSDIHERQEIKWDA